MKREGTTNAALIAWLITAMDYSYQYVMRSAPAVMMPQLPDEFGLGTGAGGLDLEAHQTIFEPLLYGVRLAIVLTLLLEETGSAARWLAPALAET